MGHVMRRGRGFQATWRDPDGKERTKTFPRKIDADRWLTSVEHSKLAGTYVDPVAGRVTFESYATTWRALQPHSPGTERSVEQHLRLHVFPAIGDRPIARLRPTDLQMLARRLSESLAPSTARVVFGQVSAVLTAAVRDRVIAANPALCVKLPPAPRKSVDRVLEANQVRAMAARVHERYSALIIAGAGLGLRPGELFGLAVDRVDFLRKTVRIDQQMARVADGGVDLAPLKTQSSYRTIPLPNSVAHALARHLTVFFAHPSLNVIFTSDRGGPVQQHPFAQVWETARKRAGLPDWATPHDLRHFYASMLIRSGASVKVVQTRLGHASAKTTLDTYAHLWPDEEDRTRTAVDEILGGRRSDTGGTTELAADL